MTSNYFRQYIAGYTVGQIFLCYPNRCRVTKASTLELVFIAECQAQALLYWCCHWADGDGLNFFDPLLKTIPELNVTHIFVFFLKGFMIVHLDKDKKYELQCQFLKNMISV